MASDMTDSHSTKVTESRRPHSTSFPCWGDGEKETLGETKLLPLGFAVETPEAQENQQRCEHCATRHYNHKRMSWMEQGVT
eukprot:6488282-Amphidinium_carterae.3